MSKYFNKNIMQFLICLAWLVPATSFGYYVTPIGTDYLNIVKFILLFFVLFQFILGKITRINGYIILFLCTLLFSSFFSDDIVYSLVKFIALFAAIAVLSPMIQSEKSVIFRERLHVNIYWSALVVVVMSVCAEMVGFELPKIYFKKGFPGITSHAMLFGPLAGLAAIYFAVKGLITRNMAYFILCSICYFTVYTSLSRAAIIAVNFALLAIVSASSKNKKIVKLTAIAMPLVVAYAIFTLVFAGDKEITGFGSLSVINIKGTTNTRDELWNARIDEFLENPVVGVGIGMARGAGTYKDVRSGRFSGIVEPGSAYLVILSMSGVVGFLVFASVVTRLLYKLYLRWSLVYIERRYEIVGIGSFMAIHGLAEGWIYSPGGIICIYFWLWLGLVGDSIYYADLKIRQCAQT